ncbi:chitin-binding protein [Burkholderia stagnalis]|uniref:Chitin-binding protein n=1 Tax=Burkholderia stagnalis TaxID=1503054 RepID=A0ABX9YBM8_9BURK|nr:chitin-binding protein [Burkholderia stagnalis]RQQ59041.1 chitin-binding protein [Burkholderia stagnalis]RQQ59509.1 chitin-binding protein [Burkholderia stagnalis]RQQ73875.1 chitin-binding protein [Burkholderia stagnalis]RQQ78119.1 chitin-binding protein [Burkholderia stagnalis]
MIQALVCATVATATLTNTYAHGRLISPPSRIVLCTLGKNPNCPIGTWKANAMESGKFFPADQAGQRDALAKDDVPNGSPPKDGNIAGASNNGDEPTLNEQTQDRWSKVPLISGSVQTFQWEYSAKHATRRWKYFITRSSWNPAAPLTRSQFETEPFCTIENRAQPFWSADLKPADNVGHSCQLPVRSGYQVILAVWEVADTPNAFYQVVDAYFVPPGGTSTQPPF